MALPAILLLLLLDEPTNGLDIMSKSQFRKVMAGALDENKCIIISTHQVKDLENLIDRITIIDEGTILFDQTIEQIANKLSFRISHDHEEIKNALYNESSLKGSAIVTRKYRWRRKQNRSGTFIQGNYNKPSESSIRF